VLTIDARRAGVVTGARVLDLGCGGGRHTFDGLRSGASVVALDAGEEEVVGVTGMVAALAEAGELPAAHFGAARGDASALPFPRAAFDTVVAAEILEHLPDDGGALGEIARVLRRGGHLALSVPRWGPERVNWALSAAYHSVEGGHVRIYRRRALERLLDGAGFTVVGRAYRHGLHSPYWWLRCAIGVEREDHPLVAAYHRMLVIQIERAPRILEWIDRVLDPVIGKSLVLYCVKRG
jgi:SAM-dependent methyltransferase